MSNVAEQVAKLKERMGRERANWIPENAGQMVVGQLEEMTWQEGDHGPYRQLNLWDEAAGVEHVVRCFHKPLEREVARVAPQVGDTVLIVYKGEHINKSGKYAGKSSFIYDVGKVEDASRPAVAAPAGDQEELRRQAVAALEAEAKEPWPDDDEG